MPEKASLLIHKIEITNCGGFRETHEIELSIDKQKNFTIIIGESGRGKSTIFGLVYWCLYGEFFKPKLKTTHTDEGLIHLPLLKELEVGKKVTASVTLTINDQNGEKYVLTRSLIATKLREESGKKFEVLNNSRVYSGIQIETTCKMRMEDVREGGLYTEREIGIINSELRQFFPKNLSDFVLFDGEKLIKFQNPADAAAIIKDGVEKISGLPVVQSLIDSTNHTWNAIRKHAGKQAGADEDALTVAIEELEQDIKEAEKTIKDNEELLEGNKMLYDEIQEEMRKTKAGKDIQTRISTEEIEMMILKKERNKHSSKLKDFLFKKIPQILIRETLLKSQEDFARLEELQKIPPSITSEGIDKLRRTLTCVCGRNFEKDDAVWDELGHVKDTIIDSNTTAGIAQGRGLISVIVDQSDPEKVKEEYDSLDETSLKLNREIKKQQGVLDDLYEERRTLPSEGKQDYDALDKQSTELWHQSGVLKAIIVDAKKDKEEYEKEKKGLNTKLIIKLEYDKKSQSELDKIVILQAIEKFSEERKKEIIGILRNITEKATDEYFMASAPQKEEFDRVEISSNYDILALNKDGDTKELSMGQSHVLGLSYVAGCRKITKLNTFLFIDSPLHNISGQFRNEVASVLVNHLPDVQIVLFVTDSEYKAGDLEGAKPVREILKPSNKIWKEYEINICKTEDGERTRCIQEIGKNV